MMNRDPRHHWLVETFGEVDDLFDADELTDAQNLLDSTFPVALALGDRHLLGRAHAAAGRLTTADRRLRPAAGQLVQALRSLDRERDATIFDRAVHHLAYCLRHAERLPAALGQQLCDIRRRRYTAGVIPWSQHRWLEGMMFKHRRRWELARATLLGARRQLLVFEAVRDLALATLDVADLHLAEGDHAEALTVARQTLAVVDRQGLDEPAVTAFRAWVDSLADGTPPAAVADRADAVLSGMR